MKFLSLVTSRVRSICRIKNTISYLKLILHFQLALCLISSLHGTEEHVSVYGLKHISEEELEFASENWETIIEVNPNKVGLARIQKHVASKGLPHLPLSAANPDEEVVLVKGVDNPLKAKAINAPIPLPSSVNNSLLPSFPPIGNQNRLGSCVAWGTTYYQMTHEYGLLNGLNNKTSFQNVFSPKWTYNNLNDGKDEGLLIFQAYPLFSQNGLVTYDRLPYDNDYKSWDLNPEHWISAISYRAAPAQLIKGLGPFVQDLSLIKQLLVNGHVLTFGTFIDSWQMTEIKADPSQANNPHAGEKAAFWMNGHKGGHCMTIVGYDDNVWIDINGNGVVDKGEKGAFLIANSWGTEYGNNGFVWISYDAFLAQSAVAKGPRLNRFPIGEAMGSYAASAIPLASHYKPRMIAQFSISQDIRNQFNVAVGISDTMSTEPTKVFRSYALFNRGGPLNFNGSKDSGQQIGTFALDLTDLLSSVPDSKKRYYLMVTDSIPGHPTILQSFKLIDLVNNTTISSAKVPFSFDNRNTTTYIDYDPTIPTPPSIPPEHAQTPAFPADPIPPPPFVPVFPAIEFPPTLNITSPSNDQIVSEVCWVSANAFDLHGIHHLEFYVDSILVNIDNTAPYYVLLGVKELEKGFHSLTVVAYNNKGQTTTKQVEFFVNPL